LAQAETSPLRSMTGFGAATRSLDGVELRVEARSVNHRFLQLKTRLPQELSGLEPEVEALARKALLRGAVSVNIGAERAGEEGLALDEAAARAWSERLSGLAKELGLAGGLRIGELVTLPGVIAEERAGELLRERKQEVLEVVGEALASLVAMRSTEGAALARELDAGVAAIASELVAVELRMPDVVRSAHEGVQKRAQELLDRASGASSDRLSPVDLAREFALLADRLDVSEEIVRLQSHLDQFRALLGELGPAGRKLDFLVQEMLREVNTIGSKCSDAQVAHRVVEMKTLVERLREQVQNLE